MPIVIVSIVLVARSQFLCYAGAALGVPAVAAAVFGKVGLVGGSAAGAGGAVVARAVTAAVETVYWGEQQGQEGQ